MEPGDTAAAGRPSVSSWVTGLRFAGSWGAIVLALMGFVAYLPGLRALGAVRPGYIPMAPSTAACFLVLGGLTRMLVRRNLPRWSLVLGEVLALLVALFGILEVAELLVGRSLNLEDTLVPAAGTLGGVPVGRMSPATGGAFFIAGWAVALLCRGRRRDHAKGWLGSSGGLLASAALVIGATIILGYLYGTPLMYGTGSVPMALTTAAGFLLLGVGTLLVAGPESLPLRALTGPSTQARLMRAFLPLTVFAVLIQHTATHFLGSVVGVNDALISAALVILVVAIVALVVTQVSRSQGRVIDRLEGERRKAQEEREALEAQMRHVQKLESLGVLAGGIAHDFNNILTAILGNASLLEMEMAADEPRRAMIERVMQASKRAADLCRQMLAYSGRGQFVVEPVDLNELAGEMSKLLDVSISKKAALRFELAADLPTVEADATQLRQVVMNLVSNASEALGEDPGEIIIHTEARALSQEELEARAPGCALPGGTYVLLDVSDTGCGMDARTKEQLFEPFYSTKFTGRGLGLAAVQGIIQGHGGAIAVESEPGRGSTFRVCLPVSEEPATERSAERADVAPQWRGAGTVLVVDDEEAVRSLVAQLVLGLGFDVVTAKSGREAVRVFDDNDGKIVCVVLDMTMPEMDGEETFGELRRIAPEVPILLMSGYSGQEITDRFYGTASKGFVQKPFTQQQFTRALRGVL